ncbi:hypothetical protein EIP91_006863 [Steccherinum ochraceum]|uniref:C2H2-type domain-containing protein n=1 Tax=Steccherinum ochraceum TaxID=92696 RepID=A0A4R0RZ08_9APHY|nr:hypothetical protein EIP91_006863 [Steccherinum ochraceum]
MLDQVLVQPPALPIVLPDLSYHSDQHNYLSYPSDNAPQYHIAPPNHSDSHLLHHHSAVRPRAGYLISDLSLVIPQDTKDRSPSAHSLSQAPSQEERDQRERERREEYEREDSIDRRTLSHSPNLLPHNSHSPNTATLSPPLSSPASAHSQQSYPFHPNYDHHPQAHFEEDTAGHNGTNMYESHHHQHAVPSHPRGPHAPTLPSIFTGVGHQGGHIPSAGPYSASPLSSPTEPEYPPSSVRSAYPRYAFPALPMSGAGIDRRMSEPAIRSMYQQQHPGSSGSVPSSVATLPQQNPTYSPSSSSASTVVPTTPHTPPSGPSHYHSSSLAGYGHERVGSGSSLSSGPTGWMNVKIPSSDEIGVHGDLDVPFYGHRGGDSLDNLDPKAFSPTQGREEDTDDEDEKELEGPDGERHSGDKKDRKTYSFVSLPGNAVKKRPRRRYDEIERLYQCNFPNCSKAYGTLNHLNAHVTMQKHGTKRSPSEFKELRKQWRQAKKEQEEADRQRERNEIARAQAVAHSAQLAHASHPHLSPHVSHHITPHHLGHAQLHHVSPAQSHHLPSSYGHHGYNQLSNMPVAVQQQQQQLQAYRQALNADNGYLPSAAADSYHSVPQAALSQFSSAYLREVGLPRSAPSEAMPARMPEVYNRDGFTQYAAGRSPEMYGNGGVIRGPRRRVSIVHSPYPDPHASSFGYGGLDAQAQRYANGAAAADDTSTEESLDFYRSQGHRPNDTGSHPSQLSGPGWPPHQPLPVHANAHTPQPNSAHHTPEHVHQQDDEPLLTNHVSLGSNRLPPDSTLLTPLPGYEPEAEHGGAWGTAGGGEY